MSILLAIKASGINIYSFFRYRK